MKNHFKRHQFLRIFTLLLFVFVLLTGSCRETQTEVVSDSSATTNNVFDSADAQMPAQSSDLDPYLSSFIPKGFILFDTILGDLNLDEHRDMLMVLEGFHDKEPCRPLIIFLGDSSGLKFVGRNDSLILTADRGGACCDPYTGITINEGNISMANFGGMNSFKWERTITFTYNVRKQDWILKSDETFSFETADTANHNQSYDNEKQFGKTGIMKYSSYY